MREVILCKYGEIILKGANRSHFESILMREVRRRARRFGDFEVSGAQSTVTVVPKDDEADVEEAARSLSHVFGFVGVTRAAVAEKNLEDILRVSAAYLPEKLAGAKSFRVEAKRADKTFPLKSPELAAEVGGAVLEVLPRLKVDLEHPDVTVRVEIRDTAAYVHAGQERGAGGIPVGTGGHGLLLLSGGIDSPVAGWRMARRGMTIDALYYESIPYTSEAAREKVFTLAKLMTEYCGRIRLHVISLTKIQEAIRDTVEESYFTLLLRRFMVRLACRMAEEVHAPALITGESLGQVASQTLAAICVTQSVSDRPILRPLIGMDKEEIVRNAREIGTFDTSILPYEDCCTVFTPRHPRTQPDPDKVAAQEALLDVKTLEEEAWATRFLLTADPYTEG